MLQAQAVRKMSSKNSRRESERLFGSVTTKEVADALQKGFGVVVDKKKIEWKNPIKTLGKYTITLKLYPKIQAQMTLSVEAE